jgi:predicted lysophospholipase L1 biosynthesis ABC-type transport system permease subunit
MARWLERFGPAVGQIVGVGPVLRYRVVGVLPDVRLTRPDGPVEPTLFAYLPPPAAPAVVLARVRGEDSAAKAGIDSVLQNIWGLRATRPFPVSNAVSQASTERKARVVLLSLTSGLTVPLAVAGIVGAIGYTVRQRRKEFAIRQAIGATARDIRARVMVGALWTTSAAVMCGLIMGVLAGRIMASTLFGVLPLDVPSALGVAGGMFVATIVATLAATHRSRVGSLVELLRT